MDKVPFTWRGLRAGILGAGAPAGSSVVYGLAFGLMADQTGINLLTAGLMSMLVYSGSAQFVGLQAWGDPIPLATIALAIVAVNARYVLLGAALRPWYGGLSTAKAYGALFFMSDGNWAPAMREHQAGRHDAAYMVGAGLAMYAGWVIATAIGHGLGQMIADPRRLGLDFVLPAFFVVLAIGLWRGRRDLAPLVAASIVALLVEYFVPGQWYMLAGGVAGSLVTAWKTDDVA